MPSHRPSRALRALVALAVAAAAIPAAAGLRPHIVSAISDPFEPYATDLAQVSPNGEWIVWIQQGNGPQLWRLYSERRWEGSPPRPLTPQLPLGALRDFEISPDSSWVVFAGAALGGTAIELWKVPIDGSGPASAIDSPNLPDPELGEYRISPFGQRVVFEGVFDDPGWREIRSAPVGPSEPAKVLGLHTREPGDSLPGFTLSPQGERVVFLSDLMGGTDDLWSAPVDGSTIAVWLNNSPLSTRQVDPGSIVVIPDGSRVFYQELGGGGDDLWSAPIDGSAQAVRFTEPGGTWTIVGDPVVDPTSTRALFVGWNASGERRLWSCPVAGGAPTPLTGEGTFPDFEAVFDATGGHAIFVAALADPAQEEVWSVAVDGSSAPVRVSPAIVHAEGTLARVYQVAGGGLAVFTSEALVDGREDVWSVPIDGSSPAVRLDTWNGDGTANEVRVAGDGIRVVIRDADLFTGEAIVWSVPVDGGGTPERLSLEPDPGGGSTGWFEIDPSSRRVLYVGNLSQNWGTEAWSVPIEGPASVSEKIHPEPQGPNQFWGSLGFTPDGEGSLFRGTYGNPDGVDLWISDAKVFAADFEEGDTSEWSLQVP